MLGWYTDRKSVNTHLVLNTRVLSLGVLSDKNGVDVVVSSLVSLDGNTWSDVGKEGECSSQSQIQRDVTLSD
jgi:hypothetical protein